MTYSFGVFGWITVGYNPSLIVGMYVIYELLLINCNLDLESFRLQCWKSCFPIDIKNNKNGNLQRRSV